MPELDFVPTITVDFHEKPSGLIDFLRERDLFEISEQTLAVGDVVIGDLAIERKTRKDFATSLQDGRLFRQLILLKRAFRRRLLIIEGLPVQLSTLEAKKQRGAKLRISGSLQIPIITTRNVLETAETIRHLAMQILIFGGGQVSERSLKQSTDLEYYQRYILAGIPGVGLARATELLKQFGSLEGVFSATEEELTETPTIGKFHAERIYRLSQFQTPKPQTNQPECKQEDQPNSKST